MSPRRGLALAFALVLASPALSGCLSIHVARVPDILLEGQGGNGWSKNATASQREPTSAQLGFVKSQTLVYDDARSDPGYPGSLTVATLRTLLRPSEESLREQLQERVREEASRQGIRIDGSSVTGTRTLDSGARSFWFTYNGTVTSPGFFSRNANVKIVGEVWQCVGEKTVVAAIGLAQITDRRSVGGVPLQSETDLTTWREIVNDPRGGIEGHRGSHGLIYNVDC